MHQNSAIISYLQANNILAKKLDRAVSAVGKEVMEQVNSAELGATRALNYLSCFTDEYNDVCQKQKREDVRFFNGSSDCCAAKILLVRCSGSILMKY